MFDGPHYLRLDLVEELAKRASASSDSIIAGGVDPTEFNTANPLRLFIIQAVIM